MHGPVPEVERHRVRDLELVAGLRRVERREGSGLAALGVVGASGTALREELEEADEEDDLPLARLRDLIPKLGRRLRGVVARDVDRELHAVGVEACVEIKMLRHVRTFVINTTPAQRKMVSELSGGRQLGTAALPHG